MELAGSDLFASIDAEGAFYQILMDPESVPMTAICTVFGLWEFLAMGFGLQAAPGHWCKLMDATFQDCPFVRYWMDDIFYGSTDKSGKKYLSLKRSEKYTPQAVDNVSRETNTKILLYIKKI